MVDNNIKANETYLGYIQAVITRMGQNAFQLKTWCITIISALLAFYLEKSSITLNHITICIAFGVVVMFCAIDTYYLYLERGYRKLYRIAAKLEATAESVSDFDMQMPKSARGIKQYGKSFLSVSTGLFYGAIMIFLVMLWIYTDSATLSSM